MTIIDIYERVLISVPDADERVFLNHYNDTVTELDALYGTVPELLYSSHLENGTVRDINASNDLLPLYHPAVADNIIFLFTLQQAYKQEFLRKSKEAYLVYWRRYAKGKRIKRLKRGYLG